MKLGSYELQREHGGVGAGVLWLAKAESDAAETPSFTVVRVHKHLLKKPEIAEAFLAETRPAVGFRHANVVALAAVGNEGGEVFAVSEIQEGELLSALTTAAGAEGLPQPVVLRVALDVLEGLAAAHEQEPALFHGELGPHQVLVGSDGVARIVGIGLSRALSKLSAPIGAKNQDRLAYAAPERVKALATPSAASTLPAPDARGDIFSAAVMLWEGLSKQRLFGSKIDAAIVQKVMTGAIGKLTEVAGIGVPPELDAAVQRALERDAQKRTRSAAILIAAIEGLGEEKIATHAAVAALVDKLAGKAIAARKAELAKPAPKLIAPVRAAAPKPGETPKPAGVATPMAPRKGTLLGFPVPKLSEIAAAEAKVAADAKAAEAKAVEEAKAAEAEAKAPPSRGAPLSAKPPSSAKSPASTGSPPSVAPKAPPPKPPVRVDEGLEDDELIEASESAPPPAPKPPKAPPPKPPVKKTMMMGTPASTKPSAPKDEAPKATPEPPKATPAPPEAAPAKPVEAAEAKAAEVKTPEPKAAEVKAAEVKEPVAKPASPVALLESPSKSSFTPPTDGKSPGSRQHALGLEKVGPGSTLGRYEILTPVARGGMASVWAARLPGSRGFQKIFAIKTMLPDVSDDPDFENMFLDEGRVAARIRHPNVVEIIDLGEQSEVLYLVMEWVDGENLGSLVKASRPLGGVPLPIVVKIASQIAAGLHAAHELRDDDGHLVDLVHRDVSPANVLVSTSGYVKIVDFGIAKSKGRLHQTRVGSVVKGKTPYLSPEQLGQQPIDRRSDIFSFGVLLYVLTTGLHPFRGETDTKTIENIALREPVPLRTIVPSVTAEFEAVVLKALQKDPKDRFPTAAEMQRALEHAAAAMGSTTTEEDVAAFVKQALGEGLTKRAQDLRAAIERADGARASTVEVPPDLLPKPEPAKAEAVTLTDPNEVLKKAEADAVTVVMAPPGEVVVDDLAPPPPKPLLAMPPPALAAPPPEPTTPPAMARPAEPAMDDALDMAGLPRKRKPMLLVAVGGVFTVAGVIAGIALFGGSGPKTPAKTGPTTTASAAAAPKTAEPPPPVETAAPTPAPTAAETAAPAETTAPAPSAPTAATTPAAKTGAAKPPAGGKQPVQPKSGGNKPKPPRGGGKYDPKEL